MAVELELDEDELNASNIEAAHKLRAFQRGSHGQGPRTRKISYVQHRPGGVSGVVGWLVIQV